MYSFVNQLIYFPSCLTKGWQWWVGLSTDQVEGQAGQVEHQGCHQELVSHGEDLTHQGHACRLGKVQVIS